MNRIGKGSLLIVLALGVLAGVVIGFNMNTNSANAQGAAAAGSCSVVMTDGTHLIVTDNKTNTLYFYSIEKDAEIGTPLKLRGSANLNDVGKDTIVPKIYFKKKTD